MMKKHNRLDPSEVKPENIVTLDFETYYSKEYTLSGRQYNTSEYIRDEQFHIHCVGIKIGSGDTKVYTGAEIPAALRAIDWDRYYLLCHNTPFDGFILSHWFDIKPRGYLDTLAMSRGLYGHAVKHDLGSVAARLGLGGKIPEALANTKGLRELDDETMDKLTEYCAKDVDLCSEIFWKLYPSFPDSELRLVDMTTRMFCDPVFRVDIQACEDELATQVGRKVAAVLKSGVTAEQLISNQKFAELLKSKNITVPMKVSPTTGKLTFAFAKQDLGLQALSAHTDLEIRQLFEARLAVKSTIGETRAERFIAAGANGMPMPVMLNYYGAHTGRWSGGNKLNLQNLPRGGVLRKAIMAPEDHVIVVADSAQIEARMTAWLAGQQDLLDLFASGQDVYKHMAAKIYRISVEEVTKDQRFIGKVCVLGLGYGMGAAKLQATLEAGIMGPKMFLPLDMCEKIVRTYRAANPQIVKLWRKMDEVIRDMLIGRRAEDDVLEWGKGFIKLPNQMKLLYPELKAGRISIDEESVDVRDISYLTRMGYTKIYGGLLTENVIQALARCVIAEQMLDVDKQYRVGTMTHDEIIALAHKDQADQALSDIINIMKRPPSWAPNLPLMAEGGYDVIYSK